MTVKVDTIYCYLFLPCRSRSRAGGLCTLQEICDQASVGLFCFTRKYLVCRFVSRNLFVRRLLHFASHILFYTRCTAAPIACRRACLWQKFNYTHFPNARHNTSAHEQRNARFSDVIKIRTTQKTQQQSNAGNDSDAGKCWRLPSVS